MNRINQNIGDADRVIRVLLGALLIGVVMGMNIQTLGWYSIMALLAIPVIMTAILKWDPLYALFNLNTVKATAFEQPLMSANIGKRDSLLRYASGTVMLIVFMLMAPTPIGWSVAFPLLSATFILSAIIAWDPIYALFKLNSLDQVVNREAQVISAEFATSKDALPSTDTNAGIHAEQHGQPKVA